MANIFDILKERILVLDGAMGTMIQEYKFSSINYILVYIKTLFFLIGCFYA